MDEQAQKKATQGTSSQMVEADHQNHLAEEDVDKFVFSDYVPPGIHYFYFVRDGKYFSLSKKYPVEEYPATNLRMNKVEVEQKEWCQDEPKPLRLGTK